MTTLKTTIELNDWRELRNIHDCISFITGSVYGHDLWNPHIMTALRDLQSKLGTIREKDNGSFAFRLTKDQKEILESCLRESNQSIVRLFNTDVQNSFNKLFK